MLPNQLQQPSAICPADRQVNKHRWCVFEVNDPNSAIVQYVYSIFVIVLCIVLMRFVYLLLRYKSSDRYKHYFGSMYLWIYKVLALWLSYSLTRNVFSLVVYSVYMIQDFPDRDKNLHPNDPYIGSSIVTYANILYFLNSVGAFIINLVLVSIAYLWVRNQLKIVSKSQSLGLETRKKINFWMGVVYAAKIYFKYVRNVFILLIIAQIVMFYTTEIGRCTMNIINLYFIIFQSVLLILFYLFVAYVSSSLQKLQLIKIQAVQLRKIILRYIALFIVLLARAIRNFMIALGVVQSTDQLNGNCSNLAQDSSFHLIFLIIHHIFLHLLPICIVLYIYQPNIKKMRKYEDLLDLDTSQNLQGEQNYKAIARGFYSSSLITQRKSYQQEKPQNQQP